MNTDEIIEMAKNSGASKDGRLWLMYSEDLEAFAKLVEDAAFKRWAAQTKLAVQDEREACAKVCEQQEDYGPLCETIWDCAAAIRART